MCVKQLWVGRCRNMDLVRVYCVNSVKVEPI